MALNFQDNRTGIGPKVLMAALLVCSLALFFLYGREGASGPLHTVQTVVMTMTSPLSSVGSSIGNFVGGLGRTVEDATADEESLSALRRQNEELRNMLAQAEEYRIKAQDLENLLGMRDLYDVTGITGAVIGRSTDAWNQTITLNVGSDDGVKTGLTVLGATGVIGQVASTTPSSCVVRLLTDPQSGAAAIVQQNRAEGIVRGSLSGLLYLENIGADVVIEVGDLILTSGLGGSYQRGMFIGTVVTVDGRVGDASRSIVVAPNESAFLLEEAIVVLDARVPESILTDNVVGSRLQDDAGGSADNGNANENAPAAGDNAENDNAGNAGDSAPDAAGTGTQAPGTGDGTAGTATAAPSGGTPAAPVGSATGAVTSRVRIGAGR